MALTKHNIGLVMKATGKVRKARAMFAEVAAIRRTVLGPDQPDTKKPEWLAAESELMSSV